MKHFALIMISLLTISARSEELGFRDQVDRWRAEEAEAQNQGNVVFSLATENSRRITPNQQIHCNIRQASLDGEIRAVKMKFKDGQEQTFIPSGQRGVLWTERRIQMVKLVNGKLMASSHLLVWGRRFGGWRFERQPELVKTCPGCDRFGDVESWSVEAVDLHTMAGCQPIDDRPLMSQGHPPKAFTSTSDEANASR